MLEEFAVAPDACASESLWERKLAGELVAGFRGDLRISQRPVIVESWQDGEISWRLDSEDGGAGAARSPNGGMKYVPELELHLLDGISVVIATTDLLPAPRGSVSVELRQWLVPAAVSLAVSMTAFALMFLATRRRGGRSTATDRQALERLVRSTVDRRLATVVTDARRMPSEETGRELARRCSEEAKQAVDAALESAAGELEKSLEIGRKALKEEAHRLTESLAAAAADASPDRSLVTFQTISREIGELAEDPRQRLVKALEAASQLGYWIDQLWPALRQAAGADLESVAAGLPKPAAEECRQAHQTLRRFAVLDAVACRHLLHLSTNSDPSGLSSLPPSPAEAAFLASSGLADGERPLPERLKQYVEPFDHTGRLGEVTLALQYLVEGYPVEQLSSAQRSQLRNQLTRAVRDLHLEEDFHRLVAVIAAGIGLRYRPVCYYKSHIDQSEYAFVRPQVSPILLSERVGFSARTQPTVVVRLARPFFFQLDSNVYYAGHAHVARG